jgi:hypothetical protein
MFAEPKGHGLATVTKTNSEMIYAHELPALIAFAERETPCPLVRQGSLFRILKNIETGQENGRRMLGLQVPVRYFCD